MLARHSATPPASKVRARAVRSAARSTLERRLAAACGSARSAKHLAARPVGLMLGRSACSVRSTGRAERPWAGTGDASGRPEQLAGTHTSRSVRRAAELRRWLQALSARWLVRSRCRRPSVSRGRPHGRAGTPRRGRAAREGWCWTTIARDGTHQHSQKFATWMTLSTDRFLHA